MIEAMACGTPVIAFRRGAVPEIIDQAMTGYVVDGVSEAIPKIGPVIALNRSRVRHRFEQRFTAERMAQDHVRLCRYRSFIEFCAYSAMHASESPPQGEYLALLGRISDGHALPIRNRYQRELPEARIETTTDDPSAEPAQSSPRRTSFPSDNRDVLPPTIQF